MSEIVKILDRVANTTTADLMVAVSAIEGVYASSYRLNPSVRGLSEFMRESEAIPTMAGRLLVQGSRDLGEQLKAAGETLRLNDQAFGYATEQLSASLQQLRLIAARRFRAALVSRSSIAPALSGSLKVMNRAGASFNAKGLIFLTTRKAMLDSINEAIIEQLLAEGESIAFVRHVDPDHSIHGAPVLIDGEKTGLPSYSEIVDKWFHPRASAILSRSF